LKTVKLFDAKNRFSELCDAVARTGEPCLVTRRGKPLVQVIPIVGGRDNPLASVWDTLAEGRVKYGPIEDEMELPVRVVSGNRPSPVDGIAGLRVEDWST
jgi:prevent-host-death family protein